MVGACRSTENLLLERASSSRFAIVMLQQPTEFFLAFDIPAAERDRSGSLTSPTGSVRLLYYSVPVAGDACYGIQRQSSMRILETQVYQAFCEIDSARVVTKRVAHGELICPGSSSRNTRVDRERREHMLSAFCVYRLSRKGFRPLRSMANSLRFERDKSGSERNPPASSRNPTFPRQNSRPLWLPPLSKLPTRFL